MLRLPLPFRTYLSPYSLRKASADHFVITETSEISSGEVQSQGKPGQVEAFVMPGRTLSVLPIGLGIFGGVTLLTLLVRCPLRSSSEVVTANVEIGSAK